MRAFDVIALLKIDVFKQVAADRASGNRVSEHLDARNVRNGTLRPASTVSRKYSSILGICAIFDH